MDGAATETFGHEESTFVEVANLLREHLLHSGLPDLIRTVQLQPCRVSRDACASSGKLVAQWRKHNGKIIGSVVLHENGQLFAELDVLMLLPRDPSWLVDAVVAFGRLGELRGELRVTPALT